VTIIIVSVVDDQRILVAGDGRLAQEYTPPGAASPIWKVVDTAQKVFACGHPVPSVAVAILGNYTLPNDVANEHNLGGWLQTALYSRLRQLTTPKDVGTVLFRAIRRLLSRANAGGEGYVLVVGWQDGRPGYLRPLVRQHVNGVVEVDDVDFKPYPPGNARYWFLNAEHWIDPHDVDSNAKIRNFIRTQADRREVDDETGELILNPHDQSVTVIELRPPQALPLHPLLRLWHWLVDKLSHGCG
jgi:hypothetical protein